MWIITLSILYTILVIALFIHLVFSGGKPVKTVAWILVLFLIPVAGIFLYATFGINRRKYKFVKLIKHKEIEKYHEKVDQFYQSIEQNIRDHSPEFQQNIKLSRLIMKNARFLPYSGNRVKLLQDGPATFKSIFDAMQSAQHFIHLQYYIYEEGGLTDQLATIFEKKIKEGVEVRMIYDGIGSRKLSSAYLQRLEKIGVQVFGFLPLRFNRTTMMVNYRNHRKIVIVDGKVAFTGGMNVADKYVNGDHELGQWHDLHLRLDGPAINSLQAVFALDWYYVTGQETLLSQQYFPGQETEGNTTVQIVTSGPDSDFPAIHQLYFSIINQATKYVYIASPYLIPGDAMLEALQTAALSGVEVRLLVPETSDSILAKWSMRAFFTPLLEAGVKLYIYSDGFLHSKFIVSDRSVASVGSANLDIRSFEQNFEVNTVIYNQTTARELTDLFLADCQKSKKLKLESYRQRPKLNRMKEGLAKLFSPML